MPPHSRWTLAAFGLVLLVQLIPFGPAFPQSPPLAVPKRRDPHGDPLPTGALARVGSSRLCMAGSVNALIFASDGKTLFSASTVEACRVLQNVADGTSEARLSREAKVALRRIAARKISRVP